MEKTSKTCNKCGFEGDMLLFVKDENLCKICKKQIDKLYYQNKKKNQIKPIIKNKVCKKCRLDKTIEEYDVNGYICQRCKKVAANKRNKKYRDKNKDKIKQGNKKYKDKNKDKIKQARKETKIRYKRNKTKRNKVQRNKYNTDPIFKLRNRISWSINKQLKTNNTSKNNKSFISFLDYTIQQLKEYIESLFEPWMNWNNRGIYNPKTWDDNDSSTWTWQLDHIIPQSNLPYTSMEDENFKKCWALSNLRPYSAKQNILDGACRNRHNT